MKSGDITIKDIAKELGVSPSTVSRALSGHPDISKATIDRVTKLADKYNYQPNSIALSLRSSKTQTIGVIIPEIAHSFFATIISGIEDEAAKHGYTVMLCHTNETYTRELLHTRSLLTHRVDGLLVGVAKSTKNFDHFKPFLDKKLPLIFFDRQPSDIEASSVLVDDEEGACLAVAHLLQQGCSRVAHLAGPTGVSTTDGRLRGYYKALDTHGIEKDDSLVIACEGGIDIEEAEQITKRHLIEGGIEFDGIFANNDATAIGAIRALKAAGINIPGEVAVIGFSDWQIATLVDPPLSSVVQPGYEMGQKAAALFFEKLKNPEAPVKKITLKLEPVIRASSKRN